MTELEEYYIEKLYPLQNGVLRKLENIHSPFYLTGGTALGREYIGHRFSDDLDFFVNGDNGYGEYVQKAFAALSSKQKGLNITVLSEESLFDERYSRFFVASGSVKLKLDFVNDISYRCGPVEKGNIYHRIDSLINILSNKISALYRYEPKDIADIWAIAKNCAFEWGSIFEAAKRKDAGVDAKNAAEIIKGFPKKMFWDIKWRNPPEEELFFLELDSIALNILEVSGNRLYTEAG